MPASADIYGMIRPVERTNRLAQLAQMAQLDNAEMAMQRNQLELAEYQRGKSEERGVNALMAASVKPDGSVDRGALYTGLAQKGYGTKIPALQKQFADVDTAETTRRKSEFDLNKQTHEIIGQAFMGVVQNPTPENASATIDLLGSRKYFTPQEVAEFKQIVSTNPQAIGPLAERMVRLTASVKDQTPTFETRNLGGTTDTMRRDGLTGKVETVNSVQNTQSPDNKASVAASLKNAEATRDVAAATRDAAKIKDNRDTEMKLADDYRAQSKPFKEVADAHRTIITALDQATTSPAATLAGATKFMKLLDPGSVVRESELGMALAASGVFDRAMNYVNVLQKGKVLTPTQAQDFKNVANQIYSAAQKQQQTIDAHYNNQAKTYGLRPEMVIQDLGQNKSAPATRAGREASGPVAQGPSIFDQADAILGGR